MESLFYLYFSVLRQPYWMWKVWSQIHYQRFKKPWSMVFQVTWLSCIKIETFFEYNDGHIGSVILNLENLVSDSLSATPKTL